ncbi:coiled-coil domain-containing protein [Defluviitalea phaphyphila]|uniref:hypothetical protein n=1 Tax=Defluviitalea phaphyphila TaxID=1473580 RepID=UPI000731A727|nr:hypothetical protein [Defluviitalea phaphyphila]
MPKLNSVRLVNLIYNNDHRHIHDETFDFYDGENALINMENGGGKSVIIQFLKQPILPLENIKDRKIESFFKSTNRGPTYVMLEFKLDNISGYLVVGICLKKRIYSSIRYDNLNDEKMEFFTFISGPYDKPNKYNIRNFPVVYEEKGSIKVRDFKDMLDILKKEENKGIYKIQCFRRYEKKEYYNQLTNFKIYPNEWKDLMIKINEQESGINEIFDNAKTSQKLLEYWILDAIEKNLNVEISNYSKDLEVYVDEVIRVEKELINKKIYEDFIQDISEFNKKIDILIEDEKDFKNIKLEINRIYNYLHQKIKEIKDKRDFLNETIRELNIKLRDIRFSQESYKYHIENDKLLKLREEENRLEEIINKTKQTLEKLEFERYLLEAIDCYNQIINLESNINSKKIRLNKIENTNINISREINKIKYDLKIKYENIIKELNKRFEDCKSILLELENKLHSNNENLENLLNEKNDVFAKQSVAKKIIEDTKELEEELNKKYNIIIDRYLTYEPIVPIKEIINNREKEIQNLINQINKIALQIDNISSYKKDKTNELKELNSKLNKQSIILAEIKSDIENYNKALDNCKIYLNKYKDLDIQDIFNKEKLNNYFDFKIQHYKEMEENLIKDMAHIQKELENIRNNNFYIDDTFLDMLRKNGIEFETGVQFINNNTAFKNKKFKEQILYNIPFLPYCIVVSEKNLQEIIELDLDIYTSHIIPIISKKALDTISINHTENIISLNDKVKFILSYNKQVLENESLKNYKLELEKKLEDIKAKKQEVEKTINELISNKDILLSFSYDREYITEKEREAENINIKIDNLKKKIKEIEKIIADKDKEFNNLTIKKSNIIDNINNEKRIVEDLKRFDVQNEKYLENINHLNKYTERLRQIDIEINKLKEENNNLQQTLTEQKFRKQKISEDIKRNNEKYVEYKEAKGNIDEVTDKEIEVLESELKEWSSKINTGEIESLKKDIKREGKEKEKYYKKLSRLPIKKEDYKNGTYDEEKYDKVLSMIKNKKVEIEEYNFKLKDVSEKRAKKEGEVDKFRSTIKEQYNREPKPKSEIGNIDFHKIEKDILENIHMTEGKIKEIDKTIKNLETNLGTIESNIEILKDDLDINNLNYKIENVEEDIKKLLYKYNDLNNKISQEKNEISMFLEKLNIRYQDKISSIKEILKISEKIINNTKDNNRFINVQKHFNSCIEKLNDKIAAIKLTEQKLEDNKESIARMCFDYTKLVYDEIMKINKNARIMIHGRKRNMLLVEMDEIASKGKEVIKQYIEQCSNIIKDLKKKNEDNSKIRKRIQMFMSTKELLNQVSNLSHVRIKTYKIDINPKNSGTKLWEEAIVDNSGGEKFIVYFTVFVTILSYIRSNNIDEDDKVIIMDNPFGPITSEHLLKPLFEIAKQYRTQLICFSDLKQHAIYECFNLIYLLKIKPYSNDKNKEYVDVIEQKNNIKEETLDKAIFRIKNYEGIQQTLDF